jgi:hypothetical protein
LLKIGGGVPGAGDVRARNVRNGNGHTERNVQRNEVRSATLHVVCGQVWRVDQATRNAGHSKWREHPLRRNGQLIFVAVEKILHHFATALKLDFCNHRKLLICG